MFLPNPEAPIPSPFTTKDTIPSLFIIIIYIYSGLSRPKFEFSEKDQKSRIEVLITFTYQRMFQV